MTLKKAFRAAQGLDAANNNIINVSDPRNGELLDGVNQGFFINNNTVQPHDATRAYPAGFIVEESGRLYQALTSRPVEAFTVAEWSPLRTDTVWRDMSPVTDTLALPGEHIHLNTTNSLFNVTLPIAPVVGEMVVLHDRSNEAHIRPVTVLRNGKTIDGAAENYLINIPGCTVYFYYTASNTWNTSLVFEPKVSIISVADATEASPYQTASGETVFNRTNGGKTWFQFPEYANDRDTMTLIDVDGQNSSSYTQGRVHPASTHTITTSRGVSTEFETNLGGEIRVIYDRASNTWHTYTSDILPRISHTHVHTQTEPMQYYFISHNPENAVTMTLPEKPGDGDWVEIIDMRATPTSTVSITKHASATTQILGDIEGVLKQKYSALPKSDTDLALNDAIQIPAGLHGVTVRLHYEAIADVWSIDRTSYRIEHVDEANPARPGIIPLATQAEADGQNYAPDGQVDVVAPDKAITPATLDSRRSTETLAGLARIATDAEVQVATGGVHRDDVIITPEKLNARQATETIRGLAEVATSNEMDSTTNDTHIVTPKKFHEQQATQALTGVAALVSTGGVGRTSRVGSGTGAFNATQHTKIVTPQILDEYRATETQAGTLWVASGNEISVNDTDVDNAIITPKKFSDWKATETIRGISRRATVDEANAQTGTGEAWDNVFLTPNTLFNTFATETRRGVLETASNAEVAAGTTEYHIITPSKLKTWNSLDHFTTTAAEGLTHTGNLWDGVVLTLAAASETQRGTAQIATQAETDAGILDDVLLTPAKLEGRKAKSVLAGITRLSTYNEIDAGTGGYTIGDPHVVTPFGLNRWTRDSPNSRNTTARFGTARAALISESFVGNTTAGSTQAYTAYLQDGIAVTPRGLHFALDNYLPLLGKAADSELLDGINSLSFVRRDINQTIDGIHTFAANEIKITGSDPRVTFNETGTHTNTWNIRANTTHFYIHENNVFGTYIVRIRTGGVIDIAKGLNVGDGGTFGDSVTENESTANGRSPANGTLRSKYLGISNVAATAFQWETARTITYAGDLTGNFSLDGSGNVTATIQVNDNSHNHTGENITTGTIDSARTQQANHTTRGTAMLTADRTGQSETLAASQKAIYEIDQILKTTTQNKGTYDNITFRDYIQIGSVRMSANSEGILEFTYGHAIA